MKKLFAIILAMLVVCALASCGKTEEKTLGTGLGDGTLVYASLTYEVNDNGTYEITGCTANGTDDVAIKIPSEIDGRDVTGIGVGAFRALKNLVSVTFEAPCNIEYIGDCAFYDCDGLTAIELPDTLVSLGENAFEKCDKLASVRLSTALTEIPKAAFMDCGSLSAINLHEGLTSIEAGAFMGCASLTSVTIPASVTEIGDTAFYNWKALTSVTVLGTALEKESIGQYVFERFEEKGEEPKILLFYFEDNSGFAEYAAENGYAKAPATPDGDNGSNIVS